MSGIYGTVKDAVAEIASRYRERCLRDAKPEAESSPHGGRLAGYEPFTVSQTSQTITSFVYFYFYFCDFCYCVIG